MKSFPKCRFCGRQKSLHKANTLHCPVGRRTRIGYIAFHDTQRFQPKELSMKLKGFTEEEYIKASENRICDFAKGFGEEIGGFTLASIHAELKTMLDVGKQFEKEGEKG